MQQLASQRQCYATAMALLLEIATDDNKSAQQKAELCHEVINSHGQNPEHFPHLIFEDQQIPHPDMQTAPDPAPLIPPDPEPEIPAEPGLESAGEQNLNLNEDTADHSAFPDDTPEYGEDVLVEPALPKQPPYPPPQQLLVKKRRVV